MIKHIFLDMDGTLLNSAGQVDQRNIDAIISSEIPVTLVSARAPMEMSTAISQLQLRTTQIGFNGGLLFMPNVQGLKIIQDSAIHPADFKTVFDLVETHFPSVSLSYYDSTKWYSKKVDRGIQFERRLTHQSPTLIDELTPDETKVYKIMMIVFDPTVMPKLLTALHALKIDGISIQQSGDLYLEITSRDAKKSHGISQILASEHLDKSETAAFGDGYNDLPMFESVGVPIVMENAFPDIKALGKFVTKSNDDAGVAYGIQHFI